MYNAKVEYTRAKFPPNIKMIHSMDNVSRCIGRNDRFLRDTAVPLA